MTSTTVVSQVKRLCPSGSTIDDEYEKEQYWSMMLDFWKLPNHINHFPGANPMSIESKDFDRLQTDDFLAALKTDGVRHFLLLTCKPNSVDPIAIMIDRAKKMYEIEIWANEDFFQRGSLYDGELVWENDNLVFVVFDVMLAKGVKCSRLSYRERMQILHNTILCVSNSHDDESIERMISEESKFLSRNNDYNMSIIPKKCVPKASLATLWSERGQTGHRNDGIIFTLNTAPVETGTSSSILKWKPAHSIDIRVELHENKWKMFANHNNSSELVDITDGSCGYSFVLQHSRLLEAIKVRQPCIIECLIHIRDDTFVLTPERERTDKTSPNTMHTVEATIRNTQENISSDDLIKLVNSTMF